MFFFFLSLSFSLSFYLFLFFCCLLFFAKTPIENAKLMTLDCEKWDSANHFFAVKSWNSKVCGSETMESHTYSLDSLDLVTSLKCFEVGTQTPSRTWSHLLQNLSWNPPNVQPLTGHCRIWRHNLGRYNSAGDFPWESGKTTGLQQPGVQPSVPCGSWLKGLDYDLIMTWFILIPSKPHTCCSTFQKLEHRNVPTDHETWGASEELTLPHLTDTAPFWEQPLSWCLQWQFGQWDFLKQLVSRPFISTCISISDDWGGRISVGG